MKPGFYTIMAAQFFSSLADNALLIASIALLVELDAPKEVTPMLKFFFTVSYVVLAAFVGAFADSRPKGTVMFMTNTIKIAGCMVLLFSEFIALRGTVDETQAAAKRFKVFFAKAPGKTEGSYSMDHTAGSFVFDAQGKVRLFTRYGAGGAEALKHDLALLLKQGA